MKHQILRFKKFQSLSDVIYDSSDSLLVQLFSSDQTERLTDSGDFKNLDQYQVLY